MRHQFWRSRTTLSSNLCWRKRSSKSCQNEHDADKEAGEKGEKHIKLNREFRWKSFSTTRLYFHLTLRSWHLFRRLFSPKWSRASKCPANEKKVGEKSQRRRKEEKRKVKINISCVTLKPTRELRKPIVFCIWNGRLRSARPVNGFLVSSISL